MNLFVDTSALFAIMDAGDGNHRAVFAAWQGLLAGRDALLAAGRRQVSLVDCVSFELMRRLDVDRAFCFDPHFAEQGFTVLPAG